MSTKFQIETFNNSRSAPEGDSRGPRREIDWNGLNAHVVAAAKATKTRSIPGVISGIISLGVQAREPFEGPWNENDAAKAGAEEFTDGGKRMIRVPMADKPQVAITVDFPSILVDKSLYITGESDPKPYRVVLNGEYGYRDTSTGKWVPTIRRGYVVSEVRDDNNQWGISKQNTLYKLADAAGIVPESGIFKKEEIGNLLGTWCQFQIRVYVKKSGDRDYLNEEIKLAGVVPEGITLPEFDDSILYGVNFTNPDETAVAQLRNSIKNTIKRAANYKGSDIEKFLEVTGGSQGSSGGSAGGSGSSAPREAPSSVQAVPDAMLAAAASDPVWTEEDETPF